MAKRRRKRRQKGAQGHGEGEHGAETEAALAREFRSAMPDEPVGERPEDRLQMPAKQPLAAGREQHDEADANAEKTRLGSRIEREDLDPSEYEVKGGDTPHPTLPPEN